MCTGTSLDWHFIYKAEILFFILNHRIKTEKVVVEISTETQNLNIDFSWTNPCLHIVYKTLMK